MEPESGFRSCTNKHTKIVGSIYPRDRVPDDMFIKPNGEHYTTCSDCRKHNATQPNRISKRNNKSNAKIKKELVEKELIDKRFALIILRDSNNELEAHEKKLSELDHEIEFRSCNPHLHTKCVGSIYPADKVPLKMFEKSNGQYHTYCLDCRKHASAQGAIRKNKKREKDKIIKELVEKECELEFSYCTHSGHSTVVKSFHPQDLVPISLFRMEPNDPKSELFVNCLDCREYMRGYTRKFIDNVKSLAKDKGLHACISCYKLIEHCDRALNLDGTLSVHCVPCKKNDIESLAIRRQYYIDIKLEFIEKYNYSCYKCKCIFLRPNDGSLIVRKIFTYEKNGDRYGLINDKEIRVKDIIKIFHDDLEVNIIELDHLPEKDQRERGLLLPNEIYTPKKSDVSSIIGKTSVKLESLKCQHLCILCHVKETIEREKGGNKRGGLIKSKYEYVAKCKEKGCSSCKFIDPNPRFFDMDHLDISDKIESIGNMCKNPDYSLDDVIEECNKCRVLCKHCHKIHTINQVKQGLFLPKINEI